MYQPDLLRLSQFWSAFQDLYLTLYGTPLSTLAAIQGHAPAAGCMLALSCDYRIMSDSRTTSTTTQQQQPPTIGLNETQLGVVAPSWLAQQFVDTVGPRQAELGLSLGLLYTPEQALQIGLIDQTSDNVPEAALEQARRYRSIPAHARAATKQLLRGPALASLDREKDWAYFSQFVTSDPVQQSIGAYLQKLASKSKAS